MRRREGAWFRHSLGKTRRPLRDGATSPAKRRSVRRPIALATLQSDGFGSFDERRRPAEHGASPANQGAGIASASKDHTNRGEQGGQTKKQSAGARRVNQNHQQETWHVNRQMTLATFGLLACIVPSARSSQNGLNGPSAAVTVEKSPLASHTKNLTLLVQHGHADRYRRKQGCTKEALEKPGLIPPIIPA